VTSSSPLFTVIEPAVPVSRTEKASKLTCSSRVAEFEASGATGCSVSFVSTPLTVRVADTVAAPRTQTSAPPQSVSSFTSSGNESLHRSTVHVAVPSSPGMPLTDTFAFTPSLAKPHRASSSMALSTAATCRADSRATPIATVLRSTAGGRGSSPSTGVRSDMPWQAMSDTSSTLSRWGDRMVPNRLQGCDQPQFLENPSPRS
jgi:hypothetical protein